MYACIITYFECLTCSRDLPLPQHSRTTQEANTRIPALPLYRENDSDRRASAMSMFTSNSPHLCSSWWEMEAPFSRTSIIGSRGLPVLPCIACVLVRLPKVDWLVLLVHWPRMTSWPDLRYERFVFLFHWCYLFVSLFLFYFYFYDNLLYSFCFGVKYCVDIVFESLQIYLHVNKTFWMLNDNSITLHTQ